MAERFTRSTNAHLRNDRLVALRHVISSASLPEVLYKLMWHTVSFQKLGREAYPEDTRSRHCDLVHLTPSLNAERRTHKRIALGYEQPYL